MQGTTDAQLTTH